MRTRNHTASMMLSTLPLLVILLLLMSHAVLVSQAGAAQYTLSVNRQGMGSGTVTAAGLNCYGFNCFGTYDSGTVVTVTATAESDATFTGWTGCDSVDANRCVVTMSAAKTVVVSYDSATYRLDAKWGSPGSGDGQLNGPMGVAVDSLGYVYVADNGNSRIQKFSNNGVFVAKWGSSGSGDGQFSFMRGVAVDSQGYVYVADSGRIQKFTSEGAFVTKWGSSGSGDGQFLSVQDVAVDASGNVYVAEGMNSRIQKFASDGTFLAKWGSYGEGAGQFMDLQRLAIDASGTLFTAESYSIMVNRVQKFNTSGTYLAQWSSWSSGADRFSGPHGIAVDRTGAVYVADYSRIIKFSPDGTYITKWGSGGSGDGQFSYIQGAAVDASGSVYVTDTNLNRVQKFVQKTDFTLTVSKSGTGSGRVAGNGLLCDGNTCTGGYLRNASVTLTAVADSGSAFAGWSLPGCPGTGSCVVTMDANKEVTAIFRDTAPPVATPSEPGGSYTAARTITLTASEPCTIYYTLDGTDPTTSSSVYSGPIYITRATTLKYFAVDAAGNPSSLSTQSYTIVYTLSVALSGAGTATIASNPPGIDCGNTCTYTFNSGAPVTLTATPAAGSVLMGWTGCSAASGNSCTVQMDEARSVSVWLEPSPYLVAPVVAPEIVGNQLEVSPDFGSDGTLYAFTTTNHLYKTEDGGVSWRMLNLPSTANFTQCYSGTESTTLRISPNYKVDRTLYLASCRDPLLYRTSDDGANWQSLTIASPHVYGITSLGISPNYAFDRTLMVGVYKQAYDAPALYRSVDAGTSWTGISAGVSHYIDINTITFSPDYGNDGTIFVCNLRSQNRGESFAPMQFPDSVGFLCDEQHVFAASPDFRDDKTAFFGVAGPGDMEWTMKSADGGNTWAGLATGAWPYPISLTPDYTRDRTVYSTVWILNNNTWKKVFLRSLDDGVTWSDVFPQAGFQVSAIAFPPNYRQNRYIFLATDKGIMRFTDVDANLRYPLSLKEGWNFVSLPRQPVNTIVTAVLAAASADIPLVWGYDNRNKVWLRHRPLAPDNTLLTIEAGKGYWIYADRPKAVVVQCVDSTPKVILSGGWNLIGYSGSDQSLFGDQISGVQNRWSLLWTWENGRWFGKHEGVAPLPAPIEPLTGFIQGRAYWMKVKPGMGTEWTQ